MSETMRQDGPSLVVVGYDGSSASRNALAYAAGMARRGKSDLVVVEVNADWTRGSLGVKFGLPGNSSSARTGSADFACDLEGLLPGRWWVEHCHGDPAVEMKRLCDELRCDAIVIGRSGRHLRDPLGSVGRWLIRHAVQPVIVVP
jgi:nucleotide-binding universal stress UspA family protein